MKIEGDTLGVQANTAGPLNSQAAHESVRGKPAVSAAGSDRLQLSSQVEVARAALQEAAGTTALREDLVARMRSLVADGSVGADPGRLADAIIDGWLNGL
jgi:flagellar biosynthesis anti-sigma factor FlgM